MHRIRRHRSLLHYALFLVVALGVLLQPILGAVGDLHAVEHAVALQSDHGHAHHDGHDDPADDDDGSGDATGAHSLLHQGGFAASMALLDSSFQFLAPIPAGDPLPSFHSPGPPIAPLTLPFRPPIA